MEKYFQREIIEKFKYIEQLTNQKKECFDIKQIVRK